MDTENRPNVLMIITDQQRYDSLGCYGNNYVNTPCIDKLAGNGIVFTRAYCSSPVCTPSRVSLFTGVHAGGHGSWNIGTIAVNPENFISSILKENGYSTWYIGKSHFSAWATDPANSREGWMGNWERNFTAFETPYYGFDHVELSMGHTSFGYCGHYGLWLKERLEGRKPEDLKRTARSQHRYGAEAYDWEMPVKLHNSTWVAERVIQALKQAKVKNQPFFIVAGFQDPHHPHCLPLELARELEVENIPCPHFQEGELDDKPPHFRLAYEGKIQYPSKGKFRKQVDFPDPFNTVTQEEARLSRAYYYGMIALVDQSVKRITEALKMLEMMDNTIIIFTSDHGDLLGDHGLWRKGPFHYEQLIRVPLIVHWPAGTLIKGRVDSIVSLVDIAPTILSAAGVEIPERIDGKSLMPILKGKQEKTREHAFIEYVDDPEELRLKTIVTEKYKLTVYHQRAYGELYDLENDPWEITNMFSEPGMKDTKMMLLFKLLDEMERVEQKIRLPRIASS